MRSLAAALLAAIAALFLALPAGATTFGVTEDAGKYSTDAGASFFSQLNDVGLRENAITIFWDPADPTGIQERSLLDKSVPTALQHGVRVIFTVYPLKPTGFTGSLAAQSQYMAFLDVLARSYPQVTDFVVGNEPNQPRYWQPQFAFGGAAAAAEGYEALLARAYDTLKAVNPRIRVLGLGLSERGNDDPNAPSNASTSPVRFIRDLGAAYRASGRTLPLMDALAFHPYPASNLDSLDKGLQWPNAGVVNLDRIKQAVWDAFHGTPQPTFESGLQLAITEIGWQVGVVGVSAGAYSGKENVPVTDEPNQAAIYGSLVRRMECDPAVTDVLFMHLIDEPNLDGFQSGIVRADGSHRPSYDAVKQALGETGGKCAGAPVVWRHDPGVVGANVSFPSVVQRAPTWQSWNLAATAGEDASYLAAVVRLAGASADRTAIARALDEGGPGLLLQASGQVKSTWNERIHFPGRRLARGRYVYAVSLRAAMNSDRRSLFVSPPFRVG